MSKEIYLYFLFVIVLRFWNLKPLGFLSGDFYLILLIIYLFYGFIRFKGEIKGIFSLRMMAPFYLIILGILLSTISANIIYSQTFYQSLLTYRQQLTWLIFPLLLCILPSVTQIYKASIYLLFTLYIVYFLKLFVPTLFVVDVESIEAILDTGNVGYISGCHFVPIVLILSLFLFIKQPSYKILFFILFSYFFLFLMANRSLLFPITLIVIFSFIHFKYRFKPIIILVLLFSVIVFFLVNIDIWFGLYEETFNELNDSDYNRNIAFDYFVSDLFSNPLVLFLGNGFISLNISSVVSLHQSIGIFNSDLGFIGYWDQFGIFPIIGFLMVCFYTIKIQSMPMYLKLWSLLILSCSLTISYFATPKNIMYFSLFYYIVILNNQLLIKNANNCHC